MGIDIGHERKAKNIEEKSSNFVNVVESKIIKIGKLFFLIVGGVGVMIVLMKFIPELFEGQARIPVTSQKTVIQNEKKVAADQKLQAIKNISMKTDWQKGGFGSVLQLDAIISNNSDITVFDFNIICVNFGKSGTIIGKTEKTVFDTIKARETKRFDNINMGFLHSQTDAVRCSIVDLKISCSLWACRFDSDSRHQ